MPVLPTKEQIEALHRAYQDATGYEFALTYMRLTAWGEWIRYSQSEKRPQGWTAEDLTLVIRYLQREIRKQSRNKGALKLSNLVQRPDLFEEDHALALEDRQRHTGKRNPPRTGAQQSADPSALHPNDVLVSGQSSFRNPHSAIEEPPLDPYAGPLIQDEAASKRTAEGLRNFRQQSRSSQ